MSGLIAVFLIWFGISLVVGGSAVLLQEGPTGVAGAAFGFGAISVGFAVLSLLFSAVM